MVKTNIRSAGASDPGRVRKNNEDAFYVDAERGFFFVVDGIGGQNAGEKAAAIAVDRIRTRLERQTGAIEQRIREAIAMANNEIFRQSQTNPEWEGMACVLTVVALENGSLVYGHVGDSRLYQIRRGTIQKLTHDHSPVGEREDSGELSEAEAMRHPRRNEVFRDVGSEEHAPDDRDFIELRRLPFDPDSALLLCSDGLSDLVPSAEIQRLVVADAGRPEAAAQSLIAAANAAGGKDNVTVLIVEGESFATPRATDPPAAAAAPSHWPRYIAALAAGAALAAAAAWFTRDLWNPKPPPVVLAPRVLSVGQNADFGTIMEAVSAARGGDTVDVQTGDYREEIHLKSGVVVRSHAPGTAVIRAAPAGRGPAVTADGVTNARFSGFRILGDAATPLREAVLLTNSSAELDNLVIEGAGTAIEIRGGSPTVSASRITDWLERGIAISNGATPVLSHNVLASPRGTAIATDATSKPVLIDNTLPAVTPPHARKGGHTE